MEENIFGMKFEKAIEHPLNVVTKNGCVVPYPVSHLISFLSNEWKISTPCLYENRGIMKERKEMIEIYNNGKLPVLNKYSTFSVSEVLRRYFMDLPECIITNKEFDFLLKLAKETDCLLSPVDYCSSSDTSGSSCSSDSDLWDEEEVEHYDDEKLFEFRRKMRESILRIPKLNFNVLRYLITYLAEVCRKHETLTPEVMSRHWGNDVFFVRILSPSGRLRARRSLAERMRMLGTSNRKDAKRVVELLISEADFMFREEVDSKETQDRISKGDELERIEYIIETCFRSETTEIQKSRVVVSGSLEFIVVPSFLMFKSHLILESRTSEIDYLARMEIIRKEKRKKEEERRKRRIRRRRKRRKKEEKRNFKEYQTRVHRRRFERRSGMRRRPGSGPNRPTLKMLDFALNNNKTRNPIVPNSTSINNNIGEKTDEERNKRCSESLAARLENRLRKKKSDSIDERNQRNQGNQSEIIKHRKKLPHEPHERKEEKRKSARIISKWMKEEKKDSQKKLEHSSSLKLRNRLLKYHRKKSDDNEK